MLLQKRRVASAKFLPSEISLPFIAEIYNISPRWACIWQEYNKRPIDLKVEDKSLRSKHWAPLAELPRDKRPLEETDFVISTGRRVRSMLRYRLAMTLVVLSGHQLRR